MLGTGKWEQRGRQSNLLRVSMAGMELWMLRGCELLSFPGQAVPRGVFASSLPKHCSDPKLGTFERKGNTGGCSGLGVKGFKQNTEQPEGLSARPQPAQTTAQKQLPNAQRIRTKHSWDESLGKHPARIISPWELRSALSPHGNNRAPTPESEPCCWSWNS